MTEVPASETRRGGGGEQGAGSSSCREGTSMASAPEQGSDGGHKNHPPTKVNMLSPEPHKAPGTANPSGFQRLGQQADTKRRSQ